MTGAFVRTQRNGKWKSIELDQLTPTEIDEFSKLVPGDGWLWVKFLVDWMQRNLQEGE